MRKTHAGLDFQESIQESICEHELKRTFATMSKRAFATMSSQYTNAERDGLP